jgi:TetR/AcrR family transcriptional regulator, cholesterol catabolism regulator
VAQATGIRKASLYHHISTKEDLLIEIQTLLVTELIEVTQSAVKAAVTPEDKLRAYMRASMGMLARNKDAVAVYLGETHRLKSKSKRWKDLAAKRSAVQKLFETVIAEGMASGAFRPFPLTALALAILGSTSWTYQWFNPNGSMSASDLADLVSDVVLDGIRTKGVEQVTDTPSDAGDTIARTPGHPRRGGPSARTTTARLQRPR